VSHRCESVRASVAFGSATYLREEPDALRSARPDPSGGYYASGIPTGFNSHLSKGGFSLPVSGPPVYERLRRSDHGSPNCCANNFDVVTTGKK